jgi:hypothetical protein
MKATELRTLADAIREIGRKLESQITARMANAASPFQYCVCADAVKDQSGKKRTPPVRTDRKAVST